VTDIQIRLNWQLACQFSSANHLSYRIVSKKLADVIVENRTCSSWTTKSDDFIMRQKNWPIFA